MADIEIFLQGAGIDRVRLIRVTEPGTVADLVAAARQQGLDLAEGESPIVLLEDSEDPLELGAVLANVGVKHRSRVHIHRCRRVEVTVNYNGQAKTRNFAPSQTVKRVKVWAADQFGLSKADANEHALQVCNSTNRPDEDVHLGTLVSRPGCAVCFDLVPKQRIEGAR